MSCLDSCFILGSVFDLHINIMRNWCPFAIEGCVLSYLSLPILIQTHLFGNMQARSAWRAIILLLISHKHRNQAQNCAAHITRLAVCQPVDHMWRANTSCAYDHELPVTVFFHKMMPTYSITHSRSTYFESSSFNIPASLSCGEVYVSVSKF